MTGYKTLIFNFAVVLTPVVDFILNNGAALAPLLGPYGGIVIGVLGGVNIILRAVTKTPIMQGKEND